MSWIRLRRMLALTLIVTSLTGCWDKLEMDEVAMISMVGIDYDPDQDRKIVYYQIINPYSGAAALEPGGAQSPVFTYRISGQSFGEIRTFTYEWMSRRLFEAHFKMIVLSKRAAEHILREVVNYFEALTQGKSSVYVLVTDDPLSEVMNHFTLLERVPSEAIASRLRNLMRESLNVSRQIELRHISERMLQDRVIVLPMITLSPGRTESVEGREANIDASQDNFIIGDGAVIKDFRLAGKLHGHDLISYNVLTGDRGQHIEQLDLDGKPITLNFRPIRYKRDAELVQGRPVITVHIDFMLTSMRATEFLPDSFQEIKKLEEAFNQLAIEKLTSFYERYTAKGWDVLGVKNILSRYLPEYELDGDFLNDAEVRFHIHTNYMYPSHILRSY